MTFRSTAKLFFIQSKMKSLIALVLAALCVAISGICYQNCHGSGDTVCKDFDLEPCKFCVKLVEPQLWACFWTEQSDITCDMVKQDMLYYNTTIPAPPDLQTAYNHLCVLKRPPVKISPN